MILTSHMSSIYVTGGTVQAEDGIYLSRKADNKLLNLCRRGAIAYVLTPRQMGKSSLMVQTARRLSKEGAVSIIIDLTKIGTAVTPEQWYLGLLTEMDEALMLDTDIFEWWQQRSHLGITHRLTKFFETVLLAEVDRRIVVFIDEIDTTLSLDFTDDFFIAIRSLHLARAQKAELMRLSFVLIGMASPSSLICDPQRTPFNIGERVELRNFTAAQVAPLARGLAADETQAEEVLQWILNWTCGHPYLTQRLCEAVSVREQTCWTLNEIQKLVQELFLSEERYKDSNLLFVQDMLTQRTPHKDVHVREILTTYREIWEEQQPVIDEDQSLIKSHLKLSGIVQKDSTIGSLYVSNTIYQNVFNDVWIKECLNACQ